MDADAWRRTREGRRAGGPIGLVALLLLSMAATWTPHASADPRMADEGNGVKRATWDFTTPADYAAANVSLAPDRATLAMETGGRTIATDADFSAAQSDLNGTRVSNGVRLDGDPSNRIADGTFSQSGTWTYTNGATGEVTARASGGRGQLGHATAAYTFDTLDGLGGWQPVNVGDSTSAVSLETSYVHEGIGSLRDDLYFGFSGESPGAARDDAGTWNWSPYTHVAIWMSRSPGVRGAYLVLQDAGGNMGSVSKSIGVAWGRYLFNISALPIDRSNVDSIELWFWGILGVDGTAWVDDIRVLRLSSFNEAASIAQTFSKPATDGARGGTVLTFDVDAIPAANVTATLQVTIGGVVEWSESPVRTGTRSVYLDLSGDAGLRASGSFVLAFSLRLARTAMSEASMVAWVDNVVLATPDYESGSFTSRPVDAGGDAVWRPIAVEATTPAETAVAVEARTGNASTPDIAWSSWAPAGDGSVPSPPARYLQWRLLLTTTNGSATPVVTNLTFTYERFAPRGTVQTAPFLPPEPLYGWREFLASHATPASTSIAYDLSFDGGASWVPVAHGQDLGAYPLQAVAVRAILATGDTLVTPVLASFSLRYEYLGPMASIRLTPANATIQWGDSAAFDASAYDAFEHALPVSCVWSTTDPAGTIAGDATHAVYDSGGVGTWLVRCETPDRAVNGTATVVVRANPLGRIDVSPANATITADDTQQFTANGYDTRGHAVTVAPTWTAAGGSIGPSGLYTPGAPGTFRVSATQDGVVGSANVTVLLGRLARIDVTPSEATIPADATLQFTAKGSDIRGNDVPIAPTWSATCGSVNATGSYVPKTTGTCTVYANASGVSRSARVTVIVGALARVAIVPANATITADDTLGFAATGYDAKGNAISVSAGWGADQGTIDASGLYTPSFAGAWHVWATVGALNTTTRITVVPGALATLAVSPPDVDVRADETVQFTATGYDRAGNPVPVSPVWTADEGVVITGRYEPNRTGTWNVSASMGTIVGVAVVRVNPGAVARIVVTPANVDLNEGEEATFAAKAYDAKGNEVPATIGWHVEGDIGTIDGAGVFRATHGGSGRVIAVSSSGMSSVWAFAEVSVEGSPFSNPWLLAGLAAIPVAVLLAFYVRQRRRIAALRARLAAHERGPGPSTEAKPLDLPNSEDELLL